MTEQLAWILVLSGIGILNTLYLSAHAITKKPVKCLFFPVEWCQKVQYSKFSKTLGIPNGFLGLLMYAAIFVMTWMFSRGALVTLFPVQFLIGFGFLFSVYFTIIQAFVLRAFCTWCVLSAIDFILLLILILV